MCLFVVSIWFFPFWFAMLLCGADHRSTACKAGSADLNTIIPSVDTNQSALLIKTNTLLSPLQLFDPYFSFYCCQYVKTCCVWHTKHRDSDIRLWDKMELGQPEHPAKKSCWLPDHQSKAMQEVVFRSIDVEVYWKSVLLNSFSCILAWRIFFTSD